MEGLTWRRIVSGTIQTSAIYHVYTNENLTANVIPSFSDHDLIVVSKMITTTERNKFVMRDWRRYTTERVTQELNKEIEKMSKTTTLILINSVKL